MNPNQQIGPSQHPLNDDTWRIFRILSEFVEGFETMSRIGPAVSIFGSARTPETDPYYIKARKLSRMLVEQGYAVITGGGPGIMEASNRGAHEVGGRSIGLNITLPHEQKSNPYSNVRMDFHYFFARLVMFVKYAWSFVCFPGGYGTLHEFFNSMTLIQTGKSEKFPVILIGRRFWGGMVHWMEDTLLDHGYDKVDRSDFQLFTVTDSLEEAVAIINEARSRAQAAIAPTPEAQPSGEGTVMGYPAQEYSRPDNGKIHKPTARKPRKPKVPQ